MKIYPQTLAGISAFVNTLDGLLARLAENDMGFTIGSFPLYSTDGIIIGKVGIDLDQHPYFIPAAEVW